MRNTPNGYLIANSLMLAMLLALAPLPYKFIGWRPEWVVLVVLFWAFMNPSRIGLGISWLLGILLDLLNGTLLGEHALALTVVTYLALKLQRQARFFPWWQQTLVAGILILLYQFILFLIQGLTGHMILMWQFWLASFTSLLAWPFVYIILDRYSRRRLMR